MPIISPGSSCTRSAAVTAQSSPTRPAIQDGKDSAGRDYHRRLEPGASTVRHRSDCLEPGPNLHQKLAAAAQSVSPQERWDECRKVAQLIDCRRRPRIETGLTGLL